ncbi:MAG: hypothetical protein ACREA4_05660 [Nitrososphaera sp.]
MFGKFEQLTITFRCPPHFGDRLDVMADDVFGKAPVNAFIEKGPSRSRRFHSSPGLFQKGHNLLARYSWEPL